VKSTIDGSDRDSKRPSHILDTRRLLSFFHATCILAQPRDFAAGCGR
jgi:hypothetical protein